MYHRSNYEHLDISVQELYLQKISHLLHYALILYPTPLELLIISSLMSERKR